MNGETQINRLLQSNSADHSFLRKIIDSVPALISYLDADLKYHFLSTGYEELFNCPVEDLIGKNLIDVLGNETFHKVLPYLEKVLSGERVEFESTLQYPNGKKRAVAVTYIPDFNENGRVSGFVANVRDISIRKQTREALRERSDKLNLALDAAHLGEWSWDAAIDIVTLSPRAAEIFGVLASPNLTWTELRESLVEADREAARLAVEKAVAEKTEYNIEYRVNHPDGKQVWISARGRAFYDEDGSALGMLGIVQDVTAEKQIQIVLRDQTEALHSINEIGKQLSGELDLQKLVQSLTDAATELSGAQFGAFFYNVLDERGASYMLYTISGVPRRHFENFPMPRATALFGPTFRGEGVLRISDVGNDERFGKNSPYFGLPKGHLPVVSYLAVPVISRSGEVLGGLFFGHEKPGVFDERAEQIIVGLAGQAAIAIDNARLFEAAERARQAAETANRLKDEFLATVSHELRTPLNSILGWANLIRNGSLEPGMQQHAVEIIERSARSQQQIIEDILDVSRIITGKLRLEITPLDLAEAIETAIESVRPSAEAKSIRLEAELDKSTTPVNGDAHRLQQIIWNLLSNAIKFTPKGGTVKVELRRAVSHVEIVVQDSGKGIEPEFLPHVFDRFRQADASTTRLHGGLGLGLAIVRHLVELHGGTVSAESEGIDRGAIFTVALPVAALKPENVEQYQESQTPSVAWHLQPRLPSGFETKLIGLRVLCVDDERDARELLFAVLSQYGASVKTAASAREALEILRHWKPDVILSDIGMPEEDGFTLIKKLRALSSDDGGNIPAAALTAYAGIEDRNQILAAGFQTFVPKPVETSELAAIVAELAEK
jgi:PAS domain S-box-containing protein